MDCPYHIDHDNRIERNESDIAEGRQNREADLEANLKAHERIHGRIDTMKNWVIAGMGSMLLYFGVAFLKFVLDWVSTKGP